MTELYIRYVNELDAADHARIKIVGLLSTGKRHIGRRMLGHPILGAIDGIEHVLDDLRVHGVQIDRLIVTVHRKTLTASAQKALAAARLARGLDITYIDDLMSVPEPSATVAAAGRRPEAPAFAVPETDATAISSRSYWRLKRAMDVAGSLVLLVVTAPLFVLVAVLVFCDLGNPLIFWQQRPGLGGRPFRLYKFSTMRPARYTDGQPRPEIERCSVIGRILRRSRLDELPQLLNILVGHMSFIGPRPLLQEEQSADFAARLLVRPGLTGFAQVIGGRDISIADKTALDVWYYRNASLQLDALVAMKTIPMIFFGERVRLDRITAVWRDLEQAGISQIPRARMLDRSLNVNERAFGLE